MEKAAGMIFAGSVTQIVRHPGSNAQALETVTITFRIEHSIRGGVPGNELAITQWIGTWLAGQRYRIGERALLFLYPPSTLGLTSCVGGAAGRFRIDPLGRISFSAQQLSMLRKDPVLGGRSRVSFSDFALAVQRAGSQRESEED
ncbi:MAG TPA: hypothetical protein VMG31_14500 [Verrucomicrobiae bacterium]|nr:hypothetical protein [Verrucomicrobiae bacterium]